MENAPARTGEEDRGAKALDKALHTAYGRDPDGTFSSLAPVTPLSQVVYYAEAEGKPHFDFITYGFSQLGNQDPDEENESGSGYEMTLRITRTEGDQPHQWVRRVFDDLINQSFDSQRVFRTYDYIEAGFDTPSPNPYAGALVLPDPKLEAIDTPNGRVEFRQLVPIVAVDLASLKGEFPDDEAYIANAKAIAAKLTETQTDLHIVDF